MSIPLTILAIFLCGAWDWFRGAGADRIPAWLTKMPWIVPYGLFLAALLGAWHDYRLMAMFAVCWWVGNREGWTSTIVAVMRNDKREQKLYVGPIGLPLMPPVVALYVRGMIWAAPAVLLAYWLPSTLLFVPLAGVAMLVPALMFAEREWAAMEFTRGLLMGMAAFAAGWLA